MHVVVELNGYTVGSIPNPAQWNLLRKGCAMRWAVSLEQISLAMDQKHATTSNRSILYNVKGIRNQASSGKRSEETIRKPYVK